MLFLTGCGFLTPRLVIEHEVHYVYEPAELQDCKDEPQPPAKGPRNEEVGDYILDLRDAGADCRDKVKRGKDWADKRRAEEKKASD